MGGVDGSDSGLKEANRGERRGDAEFDEFAQVTHRAHFSHVPAARGASACCFTLRRRRFAGDGEEQLALDLLGDNVPKPFDPSAERRNNARNHRNRLVAPAGRQRAHGPL